MEEIKKDLGWLGSSVNPAQLAATIDGVLIGCSGAIIFTTGYFGIHLLPSDLQGLAAQIDALISASAVAIGAIRTVYGLGRKLLMLVKTLISNRNTTTQ